MVEISDAEIADYVLALYENPGGPVKHWDSVEEPRDDNGIRWGFARLPHNDLIVFRGTSNIQDAIKDLIAVALPFGHPQLGFVHTGFWQGMPQAFSVIKPMIKKPTIVAGHSLGGAHAAIFTGLLVLAGMAPAYLVTFGGPRAGYPKFASVISKVNKCLYVNKRDIIPDLPIRLAVEDYVDSGPRTWINISPTGFDKGWNWGPFAWHHMELYRAAMQPANHPTNTERLGDK